MWHKSTASIDVTKVTIDASEVDQIVIHCWQGTKTNHTIYLYPQIGKKFELFNGIEFKDSTILLEEADAKANSTE